MQVYELHFMSDNIRGVLQFKSEEDMKNFSDGIRQQFNEFSVSHADSVGDASKWISHLELVELSD